MEVKGHHLAQAQGMAHEYICARGLPPGEEFLDFWKKRTWMYIPVILDMDKNFVGLNPRGYVKPRDFTLSPEIAKPTIPVIILDDDEPTTKKASKTNTKAVKEVG